MNKCGWISNRLSKIKMDNGYRLHMANIVDNVQASYILQTKFIYVKYTCSRIQTIRPAVYSMNYTKIIIRRNYFLCVHMSCVYFFLVINTYQKIHVTVSTDVPYTWDKRSWMTLPNDNTCISTKIYQPCPSQLFLNWKNYDARISSHWQVATI